MRLRAAHRAAAASPARGALDALPSRGARGALVAAASPGGCVLLVAPDEGQAIPALRFGLRVTALTPKHTYHERDTHDVRSGMSPRSTCSALLRRGRFHGHAP